MASSVSNFRRLFVREKTEGATFWQRALPHLWLAPILLIALWLRFTGINGRFLYGDEAEYAIVARYLSRDLSFLAYPALEGFGPTPFVSQPPLVLYLMAFAMKIFGPTDFAAMLPSVLLGAGTVAVVYALGLRLGGRLMGFGAAALLAVLPFHVEMSRKAMLDAGYVFFILLTTYFLVRWVQTRSRGSALGIGLATAGACLSKLPGVLVGPVVLGVFAVALIVLLVRAGMRRAQKGELKELLLQGGIGALPVVLGGLAYLGLLAYLSAVGNLWVKLLWQLGRVDTSQAMVQEAAAIHRDASFYFVDPQFSFNELLGGGIFALALVGMAVSLVRYGASRGRAAEHLIPVAMVGMLLAFFLYSDRKEGFYLLPFAPFAALFVAYTADGLRRMLAWASIRFTPSLSAKLAPVALVAGLLFVAFPAYGAASESYETYALGDTQEKYFGYGTREAAYWIAENDPNAAQYGTLLGRFTLHWYNEQSTYHWYVDHSFIESQVQSGKLKYIVYDDYLQLAFDREFMRELINKYNGRAVETYKAGWGEVTIFELNP